MENDNNITTVSLDSESLESLLSIQDKQDNIIENQLKIIEQQQKLVDHFVLSDEELEQQAIKDKELSDQQSKEEEDLFNQRYETFIKDLSSLNSETLETLTLKIDNLEDRLNDSVDVSSFGSGSIYLILFALVITGMCYYFYKIIRAWFI